MHFLISVPNAHWKAALCDGTNRRNKKILHGRRLEKNSTLSIRALSPLLLFLSFHGDLRGGFRSRSGTGPRDTSNIDPPPSASISPNYPTIFPFLLYVSLSLSLLRRPLSSVRVIVCVKKRRLRLAPTAKESATGVGLRSHSSHLFPSR